MKENIEKEIGTQSISLDSQQEPCKGNRMYQEFPPSYFQWITPQKQVEIANELAVITDKDSPAKDKKTYRA